MIVARANAYRRWRRHKSEPRAFRPTRARLIMSKTRHNQMTPDPERLYRQICRLIETMPDLKLKPIPNQTRQWLGRVYSAVSETGNVADAVSISQRSSELDHEWMSISAVEEIQNIVFRAFGVAEAKAPPGVAGSFIPVGASFDAFSAIAKVLESAKLDIMIVDPCIWITKFWTNSLAR